MIKVLVDNRHEELIFYILQFWSGDEPYNTLDGIEITINSIQSGILTFITFQR